MGAIARSDSPPNGLIALNTTPAKTLTRPSHHPTPGNAFPLSSPAHPARPSALPQIALALDDKALELDQEHGLAGPHLALLGLADAVSGDAGGERGAVADALDDACHVGGAVELAHLARYRHVRVDERLVVDDHVLVGRLGVGALLQAIGLPREEVLPHVLLDKVQEGDDCEGPGLRAGRLAVEEEVEELEADGVALKI